MPPAGGWNYRPEAITRSRCSLESTSGTASQHKRLEKMIHRKANRTQ
ncbi:MAG: hypothetical protein LBQ54_04505 [Planctomycetaceae bacterium]|nr:hypothetical protein [Planctomycetaceae bacterium]